MINIHHSICSVIPPQVLRNVAERSDDEALRGHAAATLEAMHALRAARGGHTLSAAVAPAPSRKNRNVYDAGHRYQLPGKRVMREGQRRGADADVNEAYDGAGATYDFFYRLFDRRSIDGRGMRLDSTVHYGVRFDNAMWNGSQMIYGDGDGRFFKRFTAALEVIGHEFTHGVSQNMAGLGDTGETGALNEHLSDVFGILVKQYTLGQKAKESDWLIGAGLFMPRVHGKAIRSMAAPGTAYDDPILGRDPQPAHMRDYVDESDDDGGVHINSGIPNHAFYLAATAIGGYAWDVPGRIWFECLKSHLTRNAKFRDLADATTTVAARKFGASSLVYLAVRRGWERVGVPLSEGVSSRLTATEVQLSERASGRWGRRPSSRNSHNKPATKERSS